MSKKTAGILMIILGAVIAVLSIVADLIGIGADPGFGYRQQAGTAAGVIALAAGIWLMLRKPKPKQ